MATKKTDGKNLVGTKELAKLFGLTDRRIQQLTADGILTPELVKVETGKKAQRRYDLLPAVHSYILYLQEKAQRKQPVIPEITDEGIQHIDIERAKHEHTKNEIDQMKLEEMKGNLVDIERVHFRYANHILKCKSKLLAMPNKVAPKLEGKKKLEISSIMKDEIEKALTELYNYDPDEYRTEVGEGDEE